MYSNKRSLDFCPRCDSADHCVSDVDECKAYITNDKIYAFRSRDDPLCNMMKCKFAFDNNTYHSAEQAYVYAKCKLSKNIDLMPLVLSAADAFCAKRIGDSISDKDLSSCGWHDIKSDIMKDILVAKCKSVPKFRDALLNCGSQHIVEATDDLYWGCGQAYLPLAETTEPSFHKGNNVLGSLLESLREIVISEVEASKNNPTPVSHESQEEDYRSDSSATDASDTDEDNEFMDTTDKPAVKSSKDTEVHDDSTTDNKNDDTTRNKTTSADVFLPHYVGNKKTNVGELRSNMAQWLHGGKGSTDKHGSKQRTDSQKRKKTISTDTDTTLNDSPVNGKSLRDISGAQVRDKPPKEKKKI